MGSFTRGFVLIAVGVAFAGLGGTTAPSGVAQLFRPLAGLL
ncbi:hypothetical protein [Haloarcula montana]|nr:hypothetical protein [Haloarcula sp. GH36]